LHYVCNTAYLPQRCKISSGILGQGVPQSIHSLLNFIFKEAYLNIKHDAVFFSRQYRSSSWSNYSWVYPSFLCRQIIFKVNQDLNYEDGRENILTGMSLPLPTSKHYRNLIWNMIYSSVKCYSFNITISWNLSLKVNKKTGDFSGNVCQSN
jgi:hypothetical protein